jgi:uncharacterized protein (TIGR00369 family)
VEDILIDRHCFVCGPHNPVGLHARFHADAGRAEGYYTPRTEDHGYAGVTHGGIIAALLDEAMVYGAASMGHWVATAELTIRYLKPVPTGQAIRISAEVTSDRRRLAEATAEVHDQFGTLLATARAKLLKGRPVTGAERDFVRQGHRIDPEDRHGRTAELLEGQREGQHETCG